MKNILLVIVLALFVSCSSEEDKQNETKKWENKVKVEEVIHTSAYTYLLVDKDGFDRWIAVSRMDANVGDILYYNNGLEMVDFKSKELNRTFSNLLLVQVISDGKSEAPKRQPLQVIQNNKQASSSASASASTSVGTVSLGVVTLAELFTNKNKYNGKKISVTGKVVRSSSELIMGRYWVHIVDSDNNNDLTITTNDKVNIDDNVKFDGVITLNKDFGAGYKYAVIMQEGVLK